MLVFRFLLLLVTATTLTWAEYSPDALKDQIDALPGSEHLDVDFNQFSGYLTVGGTKNMHYWLVESTKDAKNDPVVFWTNGGPGCSGLLGFFTEQGPFKPQKDGKLEMNDYMWNKVANMVFIESPCGVGFSYSEDDEDYKTGDAQTATDNYELIQGFMNRFPDLRQNKLYITSESYGGHYMPTLAKEIVDQQKTAAAAEKLNFQGFAVGNPFTTPYSGIPASVETYWGHQVVSKPTYDKWVTSCVDPTKPNTEECEALFIEFYRQVGSLNPYALDYPICLDDSMGGAAKYGRAQRLAFFNHWFAGASDDLRDAVGLPSMLEMGGNTKLNAKATNDYEPCEDVYTTDYLSRDDVKEAMHVKKDIAWEECSYKVRYDEKDGLKSMVPIYQELINGGNNLNILVYSGDDDSVCGTVGTQSWIWDMGYGKPFGQTWSEYTYKGQPSGFITKWTKEKLAFVTVHGAGHEVPTYKPEVALDLFTKYLDGEWTSITLAEKDEAAKAAKTKTKAAASKKSLKSAK